MSARRRQRIPVFPGVEVVADAAVSELAIAAVRETVARVCNEAVIDQIAELLGRRDDRRAIATLLRNEPQRAAEIAKIVRSAWDSPP